MNAMDMDLWSIIILVVAPVPGQAISLLNLERSFLDLVNEQFINISSLQLNLINVNYSASPLQKKYIYN